MPKTRKYATNSLEQPLYIFMNVNLLFVINVSKLGRDTSRSICVTLWYRLYPKTSPSNYNSKARMTDGVQGRHSRLSTPARRRCLPLYQLLHLFFDEGQFFRSYSSASWHVGELITKSRHLPIIATALRFFNGPKLPPPKISIPVGDLDLHLIRDSLNPPKSTPKISISINSVIFAGLSVVTNRQTNIQTWCKQTTLLPL